MRYHFSPLISELLIAIIFSIKFGIGKGLIDAHSHSHIGLVMIAVLHY